jgi:hypothetical protein
MGNYFLKCVWGILFSSTLSYSAYYIIRDYRRKNISKIKDLKNGKKVSIEGPVRILDNHKHGPVNPIYYR